MASMTQALGPNANTNDPNSYDPTSTLSTLNAITNTDSPVMQQAAATANRQAARSGLMNSSLAVGAAQGAVTSQAADLANSAVGANQNQQQITNQVSQYDRSQTEAERAAQVGEGQSQQQITNQNTQFGQSLSEQQRAAKAQEGMSQQQINNQNSQFGQSLSEQKRATDLQNTQYAANLELEQNKFLTSMDQFGKTIQANVKGSYTDAANNILNNSSVNINNISSNAAITAADKDKLIKQELANRNNDLAYLQSMYGGVSDWASKI